MADNGMPPPQSGSDARRMSHESDSSVSTTSLVFDHINDRLIEERLASRGQGKPPRKGNLADFEDDDPLKDEGNNDLETGPFLASSAAAAKGRKGMDRGLRRTLIIASTLLVAAWLVGLFVYISNKSYQHSSQLEHDPEATASRGNGKRITMGQIQDGFWYPNQRDYQWIAGANGEDGLLLERGAPNKPYLVVEDVRASNPDMAADAQLVTSKTLMDSPSFEYGGERYLPTTTTPSKNLQSVLLSARRESNWRYSSTSLFFILDVASQKAEPLIPNEPKTRVQMARWSPASDAIAFVRDNNLYLRRLGSDQVTQVTKDGGAELFYGVPDWVYEEEVLASDCATWWSDDGRYLAFLRTNESGVPEYPVQYFIKRPSGTAPPPGEENYPEVRQIKYPKAGAPNPVVDLQFYDVARGDVFSVPIAGDFADDDRLITTVLWAGQKVLMKETNRVSDVMRVVLVDVEARTGKAVRTVDVGKMDGGWFEISQKTRYIPADASRQRPMDGYIDTIIYDNGDHLAYFAPPDNPEPIMLTSGSWEVVDAPAAVDLSRNLVYFVATREGPTQRHVYSVKLDGTGLAPFTDTTAEGYYSASFSSGAGYAVVNYRGPKIPWQKVVSTPGNADRYEHWVEKNEELAERARKHEMPLLVYGTLNVDGVDLNYLERRPPHFDERKQYPVLFHQYSGPGSQEVQKTFKVDWQSYVAAALGYIVVTVDPRGTGFIGRKNRVLTRGDLGRYESHDHIAAARRWASLRYVDASRLAIWGWSYGGFTALKTLEQDAGETFSYGMAVAPVTDWRFYDSIYTERYMRTPQANAAGYDSSAVRNATALGQNVRFLLMHGVADDNVHMQNSLALLDRLDLDGVENYDVHVFPDSDHGIYFHNANKMVYDKLENWLVNAFNGEWLKVYNAKPEDKRRKL